MTENIDLEHQRSLGEASDLETAMEYAGFWPRAGARILDYLFDSAAALLMIIFLGFLSAWMPFPSFLSEDLILFVTVVFLLPAYFLSEIIALQMCGMTLGKLVCGLIVLKEDGSPIGAGDVIKREIGFFLDSMFYGLVAYLLMRESPERKRLGDKWGHTVVVYRRSLPSEYLPTRKQMVLGIGFSLLVYAAGFLFIVFT